MRHSTIAIIGAGPAGSLAATKLARAGRRVILLDEKIAWEKPCGGGVTHKAIAQYPFLADAQIERNWVSQCEIVSPGGRRVYFALDLPMAIFSRRVLNGLLLDIAVQAGAEFRQIRVSSIEGTPGAWRLRGSKASMQAEYVIIASGARNPFRGQFSRRFTSGDLMATAGYYI